MDDSIYYRPRISLAEKYMRHHWKNDKWNSVGIANEALLFVPTDKVERGHMNSERPYVHLSIRPCGVSDYWKSNHSINFWLTFGWCWPNFVPLVAKKLTENGSKLCFLTIIWNSIHTIQFKLVLYSCEVSVEKWFAFGWSWVNSGSKWWFWTIIWKSIHAIQIKLGVYTYWVSVQNWFTFGPCWPNLAL